ALRGDLDADYRPFGSAPDIGADEYAVKTLFATNDIYFVNEDAVLIVSGGGVLVNDRPTASVTAELVGAPQHAAAFQLIGNGNLSYTPTPDFSGIDSFTYRMLSGSERSRPAQVTFVVRRVNYAPVAANDAYTMTGDTAMNVSAAAGVLANDIDLD